MSPLDRSQPPPPGPGRIFEFPPFDVHHLSNGLQVWTLPDASVSLAHLVLVFPGGAQHDPLSRRGLATLGAGMLDEGTEHSSALDLAARIEGLGGHLASAADWNGSYLEIGVGSEHTDTGLEFIREIAREATLPDEEIERLRALRLAELQRRSAQPGVVAGLHLIRAIFPDHVYGESPLGTEETVASIARTDLQSWLGREIAPRRAVLLAVGHLNPDTMAQSAEALFGDWESLDSEEPPSSPPDPPDGPGLRVIVVDRSDAPQTELRVGHPGMARAHPDYVGARIANTALGGKFTSRINLNLRERHGITYGAHSTLPARLGPGPFVVSTAVDTASTGLAVREILAEMGRLRDELVPQDELEDTKRYLVGTFPYTVQALDGLAEKLEQLAVFGLPRDYFATYFRTMQELSATDVQRSARVLLRPEEAVVVAVGPADELEPQLESFSSVEIR